MVTLFNNKNFKRQFSKFVNIKEALRKYPPGTLIVRKCNKDYPVPDTNLVIDKGTGVMVSIYALHHDPEYYPDPQNYDPDRFDPSEVERRHPFAFLPFGAGPRNCIGKFE